MRFGPAIALWPILLWSCATLKPPEVPEGFALINASERSIAATYRQDSKVAKLELAIERQEIRSVLSDERGRALARLSVPLNSRQSEGRLQTGVFRLERAFNTMPAEQQVSYLVLSAKLSDSLLSALPPATPEQAKAAIKAFPTFTGLKLEQGPVDRDPGPPPRIAIFSTTDSCYGACGPGCGWCACLTAFCACETNSFCQWHDRCCGAYERFLDCELGCFIDWIF